MSIPPNNIKFGPTNETGKILTTAVCITPYVMTSHTTEVMRGPILICPESCYVDENCKCEVDDCENGVYLMDNYQNNPLESDVIKDLSETYFTYDFIGQEEGIVRVRMICYKPYETKQEAYINVGYRPVTTTVFGELQMSSATCTKDECSVGVNINTRNDVVNLYIQLIKEPEGIVYYSGVMNVMPGSVGNKIALLAQKKTCPTDTNLKLLAMVFPQSDPNNRIVRIKTDAFTC